MFSSSCGVVKQAVRRRPLWGAAALTKAEVRDIIRPALRPGFYPDRRHPAICDTLAENPKTGPVRQAGQATASDMKRPPTYRTCCLATKRR